MPLVCLPEVRSHENKINGLNDIFIKTCESAYIIIPPANNHFPQIFFHKQTVLEPFLPELFRQHCRSGESINYRRIRR